MRKSPTPPAPTSMVKGRTSLKKPLRTPPAPPPPPASAPPPPPPPTSRYSTLRDRSSSKSWVPTVVKVWMQNCCESTVIRVTVPPVA
ncbi:MAG: hypothetical protein EA339_12210 [Rhodobacteraceae bacterium]|nr:MAG: hypothetical protein EA339_12210 [Paracoccaceae bacterium]